MYAKTSFRDSKTRSGRVSFGKAGRLGDGGENMNAAERRRVSREKARSSGNGDENIDSEEQRGRRSIRGTSSRTERRDSSSRNERVDYREGIEDSKARNGRVRIGKGRSSGNGGRNMNSDDQRRVSFGKARSFGNGDESINSKDRRGRRSMEVHSSRTERRDLSCRNKRADFDNGEEVKVRGGKQDMKLRSKDEKKNMGNGGNEGFESENVSTKRMRVYSSQSLGNIETSNDSSMFKMAKNEIKKRVFKEKHTGKEKSEKLGAENSLAGQKKYKGSEVAEKKSLRSKLRGKSIGEDEGTEGIYVKEGKEKHETRKQLTSDKKTSFAESTKRLTNKKFKAKKVADNAEEAEQPRKNKRIRIDPYDISNKRMDDGLITEGGEEKKDLPKSSNDVEMSMNAQFRAIIPSESILSYIEDNLLGRRREIEIKRAGYNIDLSSPLDNIPFSTSAERERIEEPAFRNKLEFFAAAKISSSIPPLDLPEIAFAGRSNVGKSSMLNALTRQWGVVRTSDKPGLTQSINFFKLGSKLCLVDLPGYGFAYAKEEAKEAWEELVKEYVSTRVGLKRVCLLVDTKWGMKPRDYELVDLMERSKTKYQIVLTKTDLVFPIDVARRAMQIEDSLKGKKCAVQPAMMVSSRSGAGIRSFRTALSKIARFLKP